MPQRRLRVPPRQAYRPAALPASCGAGFVLTCDGGGYCLSGTEDAPVVALGLIVRRSGSTLLFPTGVWLEQSGGGHQLFAAKVPHRQCSHDAVRLGPFQIEGT